MPPADAGSDQFICVGDETELIATGGGSFLWSTGDTTFYALVSPSSETNYTVTVTDNNGCSATDQVTVIVNDLPSADAGSDIQICREDPATLSALGGVNYEWSTTETNQTIVVNPDTTSLYSVTVTDVNGCTDIDEVEVIVLDLPAIVISNDVDICPGGSTSITASGGDTYFWSNGSISPSITVSPMTTSSYQVTVTNAVGCSDTAESTVTVLAPPIADAGADQNICTGDIVWLGASGGDSYQWSNGGTTANVFAAPSVNTTYTVTVTDSFGCTATDETEVIVHEYPEAVVPSYAVVCGITPTTITASGGTQYLWSTGETTASIDVVIPPFTFEFYSVTVSNNYGCSDVGSVFVFGQEVYPIDAGLDQYLCPGGQTLLYASGGDSYEWSPNLFLDTNTGPIVLSTPDTTITYTLTSTDENGCTASDQVTVFVEQDTIPPVASCQNISVVSDSNGNADLNPFLVDNESYDNCGPVTMTLDSLVLSCILQDYTVTLTVTDEVGNTDTCESTVTLQGPDNDCDLYANGCDQCEGGDDSIDNDNDGLPDCANPPTLYTDLETLWLCGNAASGEQKVWVCHYPNQSICIEYSQVYTYVSFFQNDYLGPCHAIGCVYDDGELVDVSPIEGMTDGNTALELRCEKTISDITLETTNLSAELKTTVSYNHLDCEIKKMVLDMTEKEIRVALASRKEFDLTFKGYDSCGNSSSCTSKVLLAADQLYMYPNPSNKVFNITGLMDENYEVYNTQGQQILANQSRDKIDARALDVGIYILLTQTGRSFKFIVID